MPPVRLKVLLIVEQCNPEWTSVPLVGYRYYSALSRVADVTLVTHERNQAALARAGCKGEIAIIGESGATRRYYQAVARITQHRGHVNWPMLHVLSYPVYAEFNRKVFQRFRGAVTRGDYDVVHTFSPILPRYPVKMIEACAKTPFVLGPVNGGLAFPDAFADVAQKEFDRFNFLRGLARFLPGYRKTYLRADKILAGSRATMAMLRRQFDITDDRIELFHENGVPEELFTDRIPSCPDGPIRLLFVGRLVPYKCADIVLDAMSQVRSKVTLTIVGEGPEGDALKRQVQDLGLDDRVTFTGRLAQEQALEHYRKADIFCFPSIREFGGAVVLEAMAAGLPCIVADYGGIAEYVTDEAGFRIAPLSRDHLRDEMVRHIEALAGDAELRSRMSAGAMERARSYEWNRKAARTLEIYASLTDRKAAMTFSPITCRYLICLNVKGYRDDRGRRYFDRMWHKDLTGHLRYLKDLTLAVPCQQGEPPPDAVAWDPTLPGIRFVDLPAPNSTMRAILDLPVTVARLWREIGRAEVVHSGVAGWPIPMGWLACPIARLRRKPYVLIVESAPWRSRPGVRRFLSEIFGRWCVNHARLLIATHAEYLSSLHTRHSDRGYVIPASWVDDEDIISDAVAAESWRAKRSARDRTLKLLFAGRLERNKGVHVLLEAMRLLTAENAPVKLDILGQGDLAEECRKATNVEWMGTVPYGPEFFRMLRAYHAVVVPSLSDEQPRIVYDAFSQAVPILASDTPGLRACVEDGRTGIFSDANDTASWAGLLLWCVQHFDEMERMGMAGIEVARGMTHREMHDKRWRLLSEMLGERGAA